MKGHFEMNDRLQAHWQTVYSTKAATSVSWYQPEPTVSLALIAACDVHRDAARSAAIIDIGGGASVLVDRLINAGYRDLHVLDIADAGLAVTRARLGRQADAVEWVIADITTWQPPAARFDIWHDRAVLHFLTTLAQRAAYFGALRRALRPGGFAILGAFASDGPQNCSGLPVQRYDAQDFAEALGPDFTLSEERRDAHHTPGGAVQQFQWVRLQYQP